MFYSVEDKISHVKKTQELQNTCLACEMKSVSDSRSSFYGRKMCLLEASIFAVSTAPRLPPFQRPGAGAGIKTQTCRSASWPVWPPLGESPALAQRWTGCSEAGCPCPSPPRTGSAGRLCCGRWGAALACGYTVGTVGWGSPVGSEDEEKPPHIQVMATKTQSRHETGDSGFFLTV